MSATAPGWPKPEPKKALVGHTHSGYAPHIHSHYEYAASSHTHANYASSSHVHPTIAVDVQPNGLFIRFTRADGSFFDVNVQ